jgi:hypothetical protein
MIQKFTKSLHGAVIFKMREAILKILLTRPVYDVTAQYIRRQKNVNISGNSNVRLMDYDCGCPRKGATRVLITRLRINLKT